MRVDNKEKLVSNPAGWIKIRGAREHNLKNVDLDLPRGKLVVLTGLSGSGKSSLAFDTIYAEGQRRYVESLSSYARMFLGQMDKPAVDKIEGLSPAIAIGQKTTSNNPRSTVGTVTEIYDYLRLLFARTGQVYCPKCGRQIEQQSVDQILDAILTLPERTRLVLMAPVVRGKKGEFVRQLDKFRRDGFVRVRIDGENYLLEELEDDFRLAKNKKHNIEIVVDRLIVREGIESRLADSLETCLSLADGLALLQFQIPEEASSAEALKESGLASEPSLSAGYWEGEKLFSQNFACPDCNISIGEISPRLFSFNNPFGACPTCTGLGELAELDEKLVVFDDSLSLNEGAIQNVGWNFADVKSWARGFIEALAKRYEFSLDTPFRDLPEKVKQIILYGNDGELLSIDTTRSRYDRGDDYQSAWIGLIPSMNKRYHETNSEDIKDFYQQYMVLTPCPDCGGARLRPEALAVRLGNLNIYELTRLPIAEARTFIENLSFDPYKEQIAKPICQELLARLSFLIEVGLDYLTLARSATSLSGGEAQRIRLATQIGSGLMGVLYILDEPSIGLHQRDNARLLATLKQLRDLGNTVIVVEHDEETIWEADYVVDIGPGAGELGGKIIAQGSPEEIIEVEESLTGQYLSGKKQIAIPSHRREGNGHSLVLTGCRENNLKNIDVEFPLGVFIAVTGVSGSGKSSLVNRILHKKLANELNRAKQAVGDFDRISGLEHLDKVIDIDQSPIGRTPRSNPATYTGVFDDIRSLYASTREAKARGYKPGRFSFNVKGGRCESCRGDGVNKIEMHFLADVYVTCDVCKGARYNRETLEIKYKNKNIAQVLEMTVEEALEFFANVPRVARKLQTLCDVGLGYIRLGQSSTQLSGGEAQRIKLATELAKRQTGKTFYILDEPTTGLHSADVHRLIDMLQRLVDSGNTVLVIEHNLDVIKTSDYVIDLGPEGGKMGGQLVACGTPEELSLVPESHTGKYLAYILDRDRNRQLSAAD